MMDYNTARDRILVLSWAKELKEEIYEFDKTRHEEDEAKSIYSYVLAIEASVVLPSLEAFPHYYNGNKPPEPTANKVRGALLRKTIDGIQTGVVKSRDQIRSVSPLFSPDLNASQKRTALSLFKKLVEVPDLQFDDLKADITTQLPEALKEKPPTPRRVIAKIKELDRILRDYDPAFVANPKSREPTRKKKMDEFLSALDSLQTSIDFLKDKLTCR